MKCATHPDVDATGFCRNCGKPLCPACTRDVNGALYCENCLAAAVAVPRPDVPPRSDTNPGLAATLGFIPGLGAVYNGEYIKALIHVLIFGGLIALLSSDLPGGYDAFIGIALAGFCVYMPMEAYRTAKARRMGEAEPADFASTSGNKPMGAIILIAIGALLLMKNFGLLEREWFSKSWPVGLIILGAWLIWDRTQRRS
ncbi:MAG TPA: B-box zinc finger protein [Candidatus Acidoferrales bacterium]|nr:B-box zinc finger protein [Candidatus Acidoferrales bacterium]